MDSWTQLGIAGATLTILSFVIKKILDNQTEDRKTMKDQTEKFIQIAEKTLESQNKSTQATDKLTIMIYEVMKK